MDFSFNCPTSFYNQPKEELSLQKRNVLAYNYELKLFPCGQLVYTDMSGVLHVYDFASNTDFGLSGNAATKHQVKNGLFSKKVDVIVPDPFTLIGTYVYLEHGNEVFRISVKDKHIEKVY